MEHSLAQPVKRIGDAFARSCWRGLLGGYFVLLAGIVWFIKSSYLPALWLDPVFGIYSLCVTVYLLSRFSLSLLYRPARRGPDQLPTVAVVIPAMNEQTAIETTLASIFALDYPQHLLSVFAVDDGSTDATWERMAFAARRFPNLHAIRFSHNRGKRAAMAAGIRATEARDRVLRRLRLDARARRPARDHQAVPRQPGGSGDGPRRRPEPRLQHRSRCCSRCATSSPSA